MNSKLQIISGKYSGKKLFLPPTARPTQNKARHALFNMLGAILPNQTVDVTVWDSFAGSGAFGIEVLSRYPNSTAVFTDTDPESIKTIKRNIENIENASVFHTDAINAIGKFGMLSDLIFVDPPYDMNDLGIAFVRKLEPVVKSGTIVIWEIEDCNSDVKISEKWDILKDKKYGRARFLILSFK